MLSINGVSAWIEVDRRELEQYSVEQDLDQNQVTCWIATQTHKGFSIVFRDNVAYRDHMLSSSLQLDGSSISGKILPPRVSMGQNSLMGDHTVVQSAQVLSATSSRPFVFSKLELTDDDEYLNNCSTHLGEIRISIHRVQMLESRLYQPTSTVSGHGKIHERAKKAVTHCISYGQEVKTAPHYACRVQCLDGRMPLATFIFKYRDFGLLQANGIIPRPPPVKKEAAVFKEVLDLTADDDVKPEPIGEEIDIVDNPTQKGVARLRPKRSNPSREGEAQPPKRIKREATFVQIGEVIDLT